MLTFLSDPRLVRVAQLSGKSAPTCQPAVAPGIERDNDSSTPSHYRRSVSWGRLTLFHKPEAGSGLIGHVGQRWSQFCWRAMAR
jgi:hypothetical protein